MEQRTEHIYTAQQCHTQTQNTPPDFISYGMVLVEKIDQ